MKARVLPREEWSRLERTKIPPFPGVRSEDVAVVVVEDEEKVVACLTVLRAVHFEGLWIDPEQRNAGVVRSLFKEAVLVAGGWTGDWVFGGAEAGANGDRMRGILDRMSGVRLPIDFYALPLGR